MPLTPQQLAELQRLKELMRPQAEEFTRRMQAVANAEKGSGQGVSLPTDKKAKGGLAEFLKDSKVKHRVYHTTNKDFTSFDPNADERGNSMMFFSDEPFHHPDKEQTISMPVHIQVKKIFDARKSIPKATVDWIKKHSDLIHKELSDYNNDRGLGFAENYFDPSKPLDPNKYIKRLKSSDWQAIEAVPSLVKHLKSTGHDAIKAYEEGLNTYGLFDPNRIKSAIGNRGTYDPTNPDITKATGGTIPSQDVMRLAIGGQGPKNWIKGSVEQVIEPLKSKVTTENFVNYTPEQVQQMVGSERIKRNDAVNQWIERNLGNYIKKQMATHDDPIRKLAEQGIVHMPPEQMGLNRYKANTHRATHGAERLGESDEAKAWEDATDVAMEPMYIRNLHPDYREPWMEKADPKTQIFTATNDMHAHYLGFDHLVDILKQDLAEGRIRPDQLSKVSIEHAVRRAHEYDQERKKAMAETALKATEGMPVHKEYPEGYKWIELTLPEKGEHLLTELDKRIIADRKDNPVSPEVMDRTLDQRAHEKLDEALKYEGDTMGHCVGGYTPDVASGKSRIFSLRDAKNEPHVTIEVKPNFIRAHEWLETLSPEERKEVNAFQGSVTEHPKYLAQKHNVPPKIMQIKGKGNAKPKKDYIPYVQDFVKSGNWSDVGDFQNTDLVKLQDHFAKKLQKQYVTKEEFAELAKNPDQHLKPNSNTQMAHGGITHAHHLEIEERPL